MQNKLTWQWVTRLIYHWQQQLDTGDGTENNAQSDMKAQT